MYWWCHPNVCNYPCLGYTYKEEWLWHTTREGEEGGHVLRKGDSVMYWHRQFIEVWLRSLHMRGVLFVVYMQNWFQTLQKTVLCLALPAGSWRSSFGIPHSGLIISVSSTVSSSFSTGQFAWMVLVPNWCSLRGMCVTCCTRTLGQVSEVPYVTTLTIAHTVHN